MIGCRSRNVMVRVAVYLGNCELEGIERRYGKTEYRYQ